jgi:hypothetical protein
VCSQDGIFCAILLRSCMFSPVIHLWLHANHNSTKLVELIRIKPYTKFGGYFNTKNVEVDS